MLHKHHSCLLSCLKALLDVLCQEGHLDDGRVALAEAGWLVGELAINIWLNPSVNDAFEELEGHAEQSDGSVALWDLSGLAGLWGGSHCGYVLDLWDSTDLHAVG